jgi:hypothetical protein
MLLYSTTIVMQEDGNKGLGLRPVPPHSAAGQVRCLNNGHVLHLLNACAYQWPFNVLRSSLAFGRATVACSASMCRNTAAASRWFLTMLHHSN